MPAAVRYTWMFRTAAVVFLFFGGVWLWRFGFTDFHVEQRLYGLIGGLAAFGVHKVLGPVARWAVKERIEQSTAHVETQHRPLAMSKAL